MPLTYPTRIHRIFFFFNNLIPLAYSVTSYILKWNFQINFSISYYCFFQSQQVTNIPSWIQNFFIHKSTSCNMPHFTPFKKFIPLVLRVKKDIH